MPRPDHPPPPLAPSRAALPHGLTFFLTDAQRRAVLRRLARHGPRRERALMLALGLPDPAPPAR